MRWTIALAIFPRKRKSDIKTNFVTSSVTNILHHFSLLVCCKINYFASSTTPPSIALILLLLPLFCRFYLSNVVRIVCLAFSQVNSRPISYEIESTEYLFWSVCIKPNWNAAYRLQSTLGHIKVLYLQSIMLNITCNMAVYVWASSSLVK